MSENLDRVTEGLQAIPGNLSEAVGGAAAPLLVGLAGVTFVTIVAMTAIRLRPRPRIGYAMVPDPKFDPSLEEIIRFSAGLAEARNAVGFGSNSHRMVRLTLCSDHEGKLVSLIGINPRARSVAERNGYSRVELVDPTVVLGELAPAWLPPPAVDPARTAGASAGPSRPDPAPDKPNVKRAGRPNAKPAERPNVKRAGRPNVKPADGPNGERADRPKVVVARAELTLARDDAFPLRRVPIAPDPLSGLVDVFAMADPEQRDRIEITVDLVPMTPAATRAWRRGHVAAKTDQEVGRGWRGDVATVLWGSPSGTPGRGGARGPGGPPRTYGLARADLRREERLLSDALANTEPHFEFQFLIRTSSETRGRAVALLQAILAAMNQFDGDNSLRVHGNRRLVGMRFAGADSPWRRRQFDGRVDRWRFSKRPNSIVGTSEIAALLKPATVNCRGDRIVRSQEGLAPPPNNLITYDFDRPPANSFLIGAVTGGGKGERYVAAPLNDSFFSYSPGKSRWGKTEANLVRFVELARAGTCSTLFLDPHADALARVKPYLAEVGCADRIIELSIAAGDTRAQVGWNPLAKTNLVGEDAIGMQTQLVTDSIAATLGWGANRAPRALAILQASVQSLLELSAKLPAELSPTIFQITTMLTSDTWREQLLPHLSPRRRRYWEDTFPKLPGEATAPITNFLERLGGIESVAAMLGSSTSTYNLRAAIDSHKVILVRLRGTGEIDKLIASLVVYDLMKAVLGRADTAPHKRVPVHAWFDEVQEYDAAVKSQIAALLEQTAKYGMRLHLLNQDPGALQGRTLAALLNNRSHLFATAVQDPGSAKKLAESMDTRNVVRTIHQFHGVAQTTVAGEQSAAYRYRSIGLDEAYGPTPGTEASNRRLQELIDHNSGRRPVAQTLAALDTLEDRIIETLNQMPRATTGGGHDPQQPRGSVNRAALSLVEPPSQLAPRRPPGTPYRADSIR